MIRAVLDTNVFISALFWRGAPYRVFQAGLRKEFALICSVDILEEVGFTLIRKFDFPLEQTKAFLQIISANAEIVTPQKIKRIVRDSNDDKIIACALNGGADYIVTGDKDLLVLKGYRSMKIVTPKKFETL